MARRPTVHCYWVIDDSGSMASHQKYVREGITMVAEGETNDKVDLQHRFISFSNTAKYDTDLKRLPFQSGGTNIESAFRLLNTKVLSAPLPDKLLVCFISDGADNQAGSIIHRLSALGGTAQLCPSAIFTVAVGAHFPTGMVVQALRPSYHNVSDCLPLVFPVTNSAETVGVFEKASRYMFRIDHNRDMLEFDASSASEHLRDCVDCIYNFYMVKCAREQSVEKSSELLSEAKEALERIAAIARDREAGLREELQGALADERTKPLASRLLQVERGEKKELLCAVQGALEQVNRIFNDSLEGKLLSKLSNLEMQHVLSYGNVAGKHLGKSLKYNSADFDATKMSLGRFLLGYSEADARADEGVCDYIITQAEAFQDARECVKAVTRNAESLASVIDTVAVICRMVHVHTCKGTQINPFLVRVVSLPTVMQHMNSVDFFTRHKGLYEDPHRNETANLAMPITANSTDNNFLGTPFGVHLCSFFVCKNIEVKFTYALLGMQAAVVTHCLQQEPSGWLHDVYEETMTSFECVYGRNPLRYLGLNSYIEAVAGEDFRQCLVTSAPELPAHMCCEHLTKFVIALAANIRRGTRFTPDELLERLRALVIEAVGRGAAGEAALADFCTHTPLVCAEDMVRGLRADEALCAFTLPECVAAFGAEAARVIRADAPECALRTFEWPQDIEITHWQFSRASVCAIFERLNALCGNPPDARLSLPDPSERAALLQHALSKSGSFERQVTCPTIESFDWRSVRDVCVARHVRACKERAAEYIVPLYKAQQLEQHLVSMPLPPAYTQRYLQETGRDLESEFAVCPETWLPRRACAAPACAHFLRPCGVSLRHETLEERICDRLMNHLECAGAVPALSRTAAAFAHEGADAVRRKVETCAHIKPCDDSSRKRKIGLVQRAAPEGDTEWLKRKVQRTCEVYTQFASMWSYEEFKRLVERAAEQANPSQMA